MEVKIRKEGKGEKVPLGANVKINFTGRLTDGKIFDCNVCRAQPLQFRVGSG